MGAWLYLSLLLHTIVTNYRYRSAVTSLSLPISLVLYRVILSIRQKDISDNTGTSLLNSVISPYMSLLLTKMYYYYITYTGHKFHGMAWHGMCAMSYLHHLSPGMQLLD